MKMIPNKTNSLGLISIVKSLTYWVSFLILLFLVGTLLSPLFPPIFERFVYGIFGTISALLLTWVFLKNEKRTFADYGLTWQKKTLFKFLYGFFIGTVIFLLIIFMFLICTDIKFERNSNEWNPVSALWYLSIIPLALMEEISFRSYTFLKLNKVFGLRVAQILTAIAFALYHIATGWNIQMAFLGPGIWALVFGLAAVWSNGIAWPTGIHVALNLCQQLAGMRGGKDSIWTIELAENASPDSIAQSDFIGLLSQILVLVSAIILTEIFIRKNIATKSN